MRSWYIKVIGEREREREREGREREKWGRGTREREKGARPYNNNNNKAENILIGKALPTTTTIQTKALR